VQTWGRGSSHTVAAPAFCELSSPAMPGPVKNIRVASRVEKSVFMNFIASISVAIDLTVFRDGAQRRAKPSRCRISIYNR